MGPQDVQDLKTHLPCPFPTLFGVHNYNSFWSVRLTHTACSAARSSVRQLVCFFPKRGQSHNRCAHSPPHENRSRPETTPSPVLRNHLQKQTPSPCPAGPLPTGQILVVRSPCASAFRPEIVLHQQLGPWAVQDSPPSGQLACHTNNNSMSTNNSRLRTVVLRSGKAICPAAIVTSGTIWGYGQKCFFGIRRIKETTAPPSSEVACCCGRDVRWTAKGNRTPMCLLNVFPCLL